MRSSLCCCGLRTIGGGRPYGLCAIGGFGMSGTPTPTVVSLFYCLFYVCLVLAGAQCAPLRVADDAIFADLSGHWGRPRLR